MSASKILFFLCLSFIAGIFLESIVKIPQTSVEVVLICAILSIFASLLVKCPIGHFTSKRDFIVVMGFCLLFLALGILRMQISEFNVANDKLSKFSAQGGSASGGNGKGEVILSGIIINEPDARDTSQKFIVKISDSKILVTTSRYPEYNYLDKIKITGKLATPSETEDFSYKNYLMKDGIYSVMGFPKIEKIGAGRKNIFSVVYSAILALKQKLRQSLNKNFSPPESPILQGIILGDKAAIPQDIKKQLSVTGVSHIIAVSGTHVVILTSILMAFLLAIGLWRGQAFYFSVIFICFYIILVGLPASGVRSAIMGILYLLGQKLGRQGAGARIIVSAASLMLLQNPLLLFYDIGFQLSFLAVLGLIYLEPLVRAFMKFLAKIFFKLRLKEKHDNILMFFSATISAQIFTLPVIVYNFGNISFVSPLANILILPIVPELMFFGFASAFFGVFSDWFGWIFSLPCYFLMLYFLKAVEVFFHPWAYKTIENVHWVWLLISYLIIGFLTRYLNRKYSHGF